MCNKLLRDVKLICRNCGIITEADDEKATIQCIRKSFAMSLAEAGTPIVTLKALMGHSSIRVTEQYYLKSSDANQIQACQVMQKIMEQEPQGEEDGGGVILLSSDIKQINWANSPKGNIHKFVKLLKDGYDLKRLNQKFQHKKR